MKHDRTHHFLCEDHLASSHKQQNKSLKLLFLTAYYPPETGAAQTRTHELASRLSTIGYDVSVLTTFPSYPTGIVPKEWRGKFFWQGIDHRIHIYRVWSYTSRRTTLVPRILNHLTFALFAALIGLFLSRADVVIVESHPLFNGLAAITFSLFKGAPFILNVSDLWPESAVQIGVLKNPNLIWLAERLEHFLYQRAALILAMTSGIRDKILRDGFDDSKVLLFRNAVDCDTFRPGVDGLGIRAQLGVAHDAFLVLYAGTFGMFNDIKSILQTALLFQQTNNHRVQVVFAGDGAEKNRLQNLAVQMGLTNVHFVGSFPKARVPSLLSAADCVVIALKKLDFFRGTLPRKLFEAMACAKPVVLAAAGEAEEVLRTAACGICAAPENFASIHDAILGLMMNSDEATAMGRRGRQYVREHFSQETRANELSSQFHLLGSVVNSSVSGRRNVHSTN